MTSDGNAIEGKKAATMKMRNMSYHDVNGVFWQEWAIQFIE